MVQSRAHEDVIILFKDCRAKATCMASTSKWSILMAAESFEIKLIFAHGVAHARASAKCHRLLSQHRRVGCDLFVILPFEAECPTVGR